jgi:uncharacterized hydrophobic protein (TIGR00271 family)
MLKPLTQTSMIDFSPTGLGANFRALFRPGAVIYEEVSEGRQFDALYFSMLVFGCLIALLGLLLNSPAVIIGAMLISPLMGPILSCGLAMTMADGELAKKAGRNLGLSIVETILIAAIAAWLSPLKDPTPEILARINPNLMDLLVAFFSGAAGTLALCSRKPGFTIVPGVAIATAVMPPLATVGYGISTRQWPVASGSFMLFFTNLASIIVSADLVFLLVGVRHGRAPSQQEGASWWIRHRMAISWVVLAALSIPLVKTLVSAADQRRARNEIRSTLARRLNHPGTSRLDEVTVQLARGLVSAEATVQTAKLILPNEEKDIEKELSQRLGRKVVLQLDQIQLAHEEKPAVTAVAGRDYVAGGKIRPAPEEAKLSVDEMLRRIRESARDVLAPTLRAAGVEDFNISSVAEESDGGVEVQMTGTYQQNVPSPDAWKVVCAAAAEKFSLPVRLMATMHLPQSQTFWIQYRGKEVRPSATELRKARRVLADWKKQGLEPAFIAGADADDKLAGQRIKYLQSHLGPGLKPPDELTAVAADVPANAIGMAAVQVVDVAGTTPAPVPPVGTGK